MAASGGNSNPSPTVTAQTYKDGTFTGNAADAYYGIVQVQAIISGGKGTAEAKIAAFKAAGIGIAVTPSEMADTLLKMM